MKKIFIILLFIVVSLSGCISKKQTDNTFYRANISNPGAYGYSIEYTNVKNDISSDIRPKDNIVFDIPSSTDKEFNDNFTLCNKTNFFNIEKNIYFNTNDVVEDKSKCEVILSRFYDSKLEYVTCLFNKKDLSEKLYTSLIDEIGKDDSIKNIKNKNCIINK